MSLKPMLIYYNHHDHDINIDNHHDHHDTNDNDHPEANNHGHSDKNHRGQPSLLVAGVGRGREESSMLTAIKEAARR